MCQICCPFLLIFYVITFFMGLASRLGVLFCFVLFLTFVSVWFNLAGSRRHFLSQTTVKQTLTYSTRVYESESQRQTVTDIAGCRVSGCGHA